MTSATLLGTVLALMAVALVSCAFICGDTNDLAFCQKLHAPITAPWKCGHGCDGGTP